MASPVPVDEVLFTGGHRPASEKLRIPGMLLVVFAVGGAIAINKPLGILLAGLVSACLFLFARDLFTIFTTALLGGVLVLDFGFANLGFRTPFAPVPLTELLLLPLAATALLQKKYRPPTRILVPMFAFMVIVLVRLLVDYPRYGIFAVRDTTTAIEALCLVVGFAAVIKGGVKPWIGRFRVIFVVLLCYASLYPFATWLTGISPLVGLQRPVPLLGLMYGTPYAVGAASIYFAVFTRGAARAFLLLWAAALVALFQVRGLYVMLPLAALAVGWCFRSRTKVLVAFGSIAVVAILIISTLGSLGIEGRVGTLDPDFFAAHFQTLLGGEGPSSGTISARGDWLLRSLKELQSPNDWLFGIGLGPDLAFGLRGLEDQAVRKPHNDYLEVLVRTGLIGLGAFLWLLISALLPSVYSARGRDETEERRFSAWIVGASVLYIGSAATQPLLAFPFGSVPLYFFLGMGLGAHARSAERLESHETSPPNSMTLSSTTYKESGNP